MEVKCLLARRTGMAVCLFTRWHCGFAWVLGARCASAVPAARYEHCEHCSFDVASRGSSRPHYADPHRHSNRRWDVHVSPSSHY